MTTDARHRVRFTWRTALVLVALLLVALNLRISIVAIGPVVPEIRADLDFSRGMAGLLTTLPIICYGLLAPVGALLGRWIGGNWTVLLAIVAIAIGIVVRSAGGATVVFVGSILLGAGVAIGNVIVPALVKADLASMAGVAMALYVAAVTGGATIGAATTAPLIYTYGLTWRGALAVAAIPAALAAIVWLVRMSAPDGRAIPSRRHRAGQTASTGGSSSVAAVIWRSSTAWALAAFMGLQSFLFYALLAWLPDLLRESGMSATDAGGMLSLFALIGIGGALVVPEIAARLPDQRPLGVIIAVTLSGGIIAMWLVPALLVPAIIVLGIATGMAFGLCMILIVLRAAHGAAARELSGMIQGVGYLIAASGPFLIGYLRDVSGGWSVSLLFLAVLGIPMVVAAFFAGRRVELG